MKFRTFCLDLTHLTNSVQVGNGLTMSWNMYFSLGCLFLFYIFELLIQLSNVALFNQLCLSSLPLHVNLSCLTLHENVSTKLFLTYNNYRYWLLPVYPAFSGLHLGWWSQGQQKAKSVGFNPSLFSTNRDEILCNIIAIQVEHPDTTLCVLMGNLVLFTDCIKSLWHWHVFGHLETDFALTWCNSRY